MSSLTVKVLHREFFYNGIRHYPVTVSAESRARTPTPLEFHSGKAAWIR